MDFLKSFFKPSNHNHSSPLVGVVPYGKNKQDGSHDHRHNKGADRTPAQKAGDEKRKKP